jgi:osmotically-inducible protein OsmY
MVLMILLAGCRGYRSPGDSEPLRAAIEDRNLATRVRNELGRAPATAAYDTITVGCRGGVVTLDGKVDRRAARERNVAVAESCEGVRSVRARINVRGD